MPSIVDGFCRLPSLASAGDSIAPDGYPLFWLLRISVYEGRRTSNESNALANCPTERWSGEEFFHSTDAKTLERISSVARTGKSSLRKMQQHKEVIVVGLENRFSLTCQETGAGTHPRRVPTFFPVESPLQCQRSQGQG